MTQALIHTDRGNRSATISECGRPKAEAPVETSGTSWLHPLTRIEEPPEDDETRFRRLNFCTIGEPAWQRL